MSEGRYPIIISKQEGSTVKYTFIVEFKRNLRFRCLLCGRCCTGYDGGLKLELYQSDIDFIKDKRYENFYTTSFHGIVAYIPFK